MSSLTAKNQLLIVLAGGGTGGHVTPALALADAVTRELPGAQVLFIGTAHGLEATLVPKRGYRIELVEGQRIVGGGLAMKVKGISSLLRGIAQARAILKREKPSIVIGVGGYASGAALLAAKTLGIATAVHESNAVPGLTNKVLGRLVDRVYLGFAAAQPNFSNKISVISGNPVRAPIALVGPQRPPRQVGVAHILIVGGSQGSEFLNKQVPALLAEVSKLGVELEIRHQVGKLDAEPVREAYAKAHLSVTTESFIDDMAAAYAWADFAITRSGSGTVAELAAAALPALLVPFPFAAGDHQAANARVFAESGAGLWVRQADWQAERLAKQVAEILQNVDVWTKASSASLAFAAPDAAGAVIRDCRNWLSKRGFSFPLSLQAVS